MTTHERTGGTAVERHDADTAANEADIRHDERGGAVSAAIAGAFFGFIFGLFNWITPVLSGLTLALYGLLYGAIIGAVFGLIVHALSGGRRDFASASGVRADRYAVVVDQEVADEAADLLRTMR